LIALTELLKLQKSGQFPYARYLRILSLAALFSDSSMLLGWVNVPFSAGLALMIEFIMNQSESQR
jgi:hypothetical protein